MEEFAPLRLFCPLMLDGLCMFANEVTRRSIIPYLVLLEEVYGFIPFRPILLFPFSGTRAYAQMRM